MRPIATPEETERYIEDNQEYFFMTVKVPDGLASGDTFQVQAERESDDDPEFPPVQVTVPEGVEGGQMVRVQFTTGLPARPSDGAEAARPRADGAGEAGAEDAESGPEVLDDNEEAAVDSGEAATLEEAQQVLSAQGRAAALQSFVDRGEAATFEEAQQVLSRQGRAASLSNSASPSRRPP